MMEQNLWGMIATWRMAYEGLSEGCAQLAQGQSAKNALLHAVCEVENYPYYKSVGYGGLPNERGVVELDAAYMDGDTFAMGAVASLRDIANPVRVAQALSCERFNCFLVGEGAREWALSQGFSAKEMLTERASQHYTKRCRETVAKGLSPYAGHDTVGMIALDQQGSLQVATSTSGLFMKRAGRVGDSPVVGSGFYADSKIGAATATGLGEDLMKGCISYEIVRRMGEGMHPQQAADSAVWDLEIRLRERYGRVGDLSLVCMNCHGEFGVATNIDNFSFSVATSRYPATIYLASRYGRKTAYQVADQAWLDAYQVRISAPIE